MILLHLYTMIKDRDTYIDSLKGLLIILVVFGHTIDAYRGQSHLMTAIYNFIYSFHMPLFIFISGYFSKTSDTNKIRRQVFILLETYIIFQIFRQVIPSIYHMTSIKGLIYNILSPGWALWYLASLITWKIVTPLLNKFISRNLLIPMSIVVCLIAGFTSKIGYPLSLSRTLFFYPFFLLGYYANKSWIDKFRSLPKILSFVILCCIFIAFYIYSDYKTYDFLSGAKSYATIGGGFVYNVIVRVFFILVALLVSILVININTDYKILSTIGKDSLVYYIFHISILIFINRVLLYLQITPTFISLILLSILIIAGLYVFASLNISKVILNPISSLRAMKTNKEL